MSRAALIASELGCTAYHEAGHAAVRVAFGLPIEDMVVEVRVPLLGEPSGGGEVTGGGGLTFDDLDEETAYNSGIVSYAGAEAEAWWEAYEHGFHINHARRRAFGASADGDMENVAMYLDRLGAGRRLARQWEQEARGMVAEVWDSIVNIGEAVKETGYLTGAEIYALA